MDKKRGLIEMANKNLSKLPYKGTRDFFPNEMKIRNWFFSKMKEVVESYCYEQYDGPMLENFDIYAAKSGEEIAKEQTYNFLDKGGRHLAIRPEMTPTVARMVAQKIGSLSLPLRWYSIPNLLRYENPQKGRLREHWQLNVDLFGDSEIVADFEIISVVVGLLTSFGANESMFKIKISNRRFMNEVLKSILNVDDEKVRLVTKALDKKNKISREEYIKWLLEIGINMDKVEKLDTILSTPFEDVLNLINISSETSNEIQMFLNLIKESNLSKYCEFDFSIIRGFDYYTGMVFEVFDSSPENRRSIFGGGRYDNLVALFEDKAKVSGVGFGFGDVTFEDFLVTHNLIPDLSSNNNKVMIVTFNDVSYSEYLYVSDELRKNKIKNSIYLYNEKKLKQQLSYAEKNGYGFCIIIGSKEIEDGRVKVKNLNKRLEYDLSKEEYIGFLLTELNN